VVFEKGETDASVLDGFTITGGSGSKAEDALWGGGILFNASSGTVSNCAIVQNMAKHGGGVLCVYQCTPRLIDCVIADNLALGSGGCGGGLFPSGSSLILTNCIIKGNSAGMSGGGIFCYNHSSLIMTDCIITGNTAYYGGGVKFESALSTTITRCIIAGNKSRTWGGGFEVVYGSAAVTNCVITRNMAVTTGGGVWLGDGSAMFTNSIIWANTAPKGRQISLEVSSVLDITYSDVAGGEAGVYADASSTLDWGVSNIDANPCFANIGYWADINDPKIVVVPGTPYGESDDPNAVWIEDDCHLKSEAGRWDQNSESWVLDDITSPCIDRGDPNSPVGDEPMPNGGIINMGAYGGTPEASMSIGQLPPLPPLAHWKLDEAEGNIAHDRIGNCDGTLNGEPLWQPTGGKVDGALQFDGVDDYVSTPFFLNPADGELSVFTWIKGGAPGQVIISQADGADWLSAGPSEGNLMTELMRPGRGAAALMSNFLIIDGQWHLIGFVWDGSQRILYVDDIEVARDVKTQGSLEGSDGGLHIGAGKNLEPGSFWSGLIDDVRIYNRAVTP
jgi:hypothetical protein